MNQFQIEPQNYLVLIVDDTESNVRLLSHVLRKAAFNLIVAFNGTDALAMARDRKPDLILLDVLMPDITGFEVCRQLKADEKLSSIPVIFLSALTETSNKIEGLEAGGVDYITKPFQKDETIARIKTHLLLNQLQKERDERIYQLKQNEIKLKDLNRQKDELVRIVSHDIQNPITGIIGLSGLLQKQKSIPQSEQLKMLSVIEQSGRKLLHLVEQILSAGKNHHPDDGATLNSTQIEDMLLRVIEVNAPKAMLKQIDLSYTNNCTIEQARLDEVKIEITLNNLISNALKFTSTYGKVELIAANTEKELLIKVCDNGIGIPANLVDKLFISAEHRLQQVGTAGEIGTGLGLDVVQDYIDLHRGKIAVESTEHVGSIFKISIPLI